MLVLLFFINFFRFFDQYPTGIFLGYFFYPPFRVGLGPNYVQKSEPDFKSREICLKVFFEIRNLVEHFFEIIIFWTNLFLEATIFILTKSVTKSFIFYYFFGIF